MEKASISKTEFNFDEIWNEHEPYIRKLCKYKLSSMPCFIDDCVQEVFKALTEAMAKGTEIVHMKPWLTAVANNIIKDLYTQDKKERERLVPLEHIESIGETNNGELEEELKKKQKIPWAYSLKYEKITASRK